MSNCLTDLLNYEGRFVSSRGKEGLAGVKGLNESFEIGRRIYIIDFATFKNGKKYAFGEFFRCLAPQSPIVLTAYNSIRFTQNNKPAIGSYEGNNFYWSFTPQELSTALSQAGFEDIKIEPLGIFLYLISLSVRGSFQFVDRPIKPPIPPLPQNRDPLLGSLRKGYTNTDLTYFWHITTVATQRSWSGAATNKPFYTIT